MLKLKLCLRRGVVGLCLLLVAVSVGAQSVPPELMNGLKWRLIGPFRGGRAVAVAGVPGDSTTFYFGAVNGGIWKTTDAGVVWTPVFDKQAIGAIGAIAVAPSDAKTIYVGTGESDIRSDLSSGNGVYKSSDGGVSWLHVGLEETRQISRIVVDPKNADVVYVGALGMLTLRMNSAASTNLWTEERIGRGFWSRERKSGFRIWRSVRGIRKFCLPGCGMRGVRRGALMLRLMDPAAGFIDRWMRGRRGRG